MMKKFVASLMLLAASTAYATDDNWIVITSSSKLEYSIKKHSVIVEKTTGGTSVVTALGRSVDIKSTRVSVFQMYVPIADCIANRGVFVVTDLYGEVTGEAAFVYSLGNVASDLAEVICNTYKRSVVPSKSNKIRPTV